MGVVSTRFWALYLWRSLASFLCQSDLIYAISGACRFKRNLRIKPTSANWCVLRECAQEPLQLYCFRSAAENLKWDGWFKQKATLYAMWWKQILPLGILVLLVVGLDRWRMLLVISLQNGAIYSDFLHDRKLNISSSRMDSRFRQFGKRNMVMVLLTKYLITIGLLCLRDRCAQFVLPEYFVDGFEQKRHEERCSVQDSRTWVEVWDWFVRQNSKQECTCSQFMSVCTSKKGHCVSVSV